MHTHVLKAGGEPIALAAAADSVTLATKTDLVFWLVGTMSLLTVLTFAIARAWRDQP